MSNMTRDDDGNGVLTLDGHREEVAIIITNDGEVGVLRTWRDTDEPELAAHAWLAEGIARAITNPELLTELQEIASRAFMDSAPMEVEKPPLLN